MLLPLVGACAVVGPFQGPEWEPVRNLVSQDLSCRDPRCCGNLLVFCLFLIWQIQHYWYQVIRTSKRNVIKVPLQRWATPSIRCETSFGMIPKFFSHGKIRGLDVHVQQWTQKQRWGHLKSLRQHWTTQYLQPPPQDPCQDLCWVVHTSSEPIFCTSFFSSACLHPQENSWEAWQVPWCFRNSQAHPSMNICQRMGQLLALSQKTLVPVEPVSLRFSSVSTALAISLPDFPLAQRPEFCLQEFLYDPLNQQLEMSTEKSLDSPQNPLVLQDKTQTGREYSEDTLQYTKKEESRREDAWEIQAFGSFLPIGIRVEEDGKTKALGCRNQRLVRRETDREISILGWEKQDQMRTEDGEQTEKLWKKSQGEPGDNNPPTQAHMRDNQEQFRCRTDIATQTPEWGNQEDARETQALGRNEEQSRGEEEGEVQAQGLETPVWTGSKNSEDSQMPKQGTQDQIGGNAGTETEAEGGRNKGQIGGEDGVKIQTSGRENLREVKQDNEETPLEWEKQGCAGTENEIQTLVGENQGQSGREITGKTEASEREDWNLSRREVQVDMKRLKEIREEDWVVIQAPWWGNQRLVLVAIDRGLGTLCGGNQIQVRGEHTSEIQSPESELRKGGVDDGTNSLTPEAKNQGQLRGNSDCETYLVGSKNKEKTEKEKGRDNQVLGKINLKGVKGKDEAQTQKLGEEYQAQLGNEFHKKIHRAKQKNQEEIRDVNSINNQTENWEELTSNVDDATHAAGFTKAEKVGGGDGTEVLIPGLKVSRGAGGQEGTETKAAMEKSQSRLGSDMGSNTHSPESKNQKHMGSEDETEAQAPEKEIQREVGDDDIKTQRPESENQGQLTDTGGSHSARWRSWEQARGDNASENGASEKKNQRDAESEDDGKIQRPRRKNQGWLRNVNGKTYLLEQKNQQHFGDGNDAETETQGKGSLRNFTCGDNPEVQASMGKDQRQSMCRTDGEIQTQGQRIQSKGRDAAAEIQDAGVQGTCRAEDSEQSHTLRRRDKSQVRRKVRRKDAIRPSLQGNSSGSMGPTGRKCSLAQPASPISRSGAPAHKQPVAGNVDPTLCPEEYLSSQGTAPDWKHRDGVSESSQRAQPGSRRQERDKKVDPGKDSSLMWQPPHPQSQASSIFPSLLYPRVPQAAPALASAPAALTILPNWPALKKSKRLLLESLMKRRIAHLRWGLPRRILESYLVFHFLESCSLPGAGVRLSGLHTHQELQTQKERHRESQGSRLGPESPDRSQSHPALERSSSKLPTQVQALEKCRPPKSKGSSVPPKKPRSNRPPGGAREPQIQKEAPKVKMPAQGNPRPAAESRSWCGPGQVQDLSIKNSRGRKMIRPGFSHVEERASSRVSASSNTEGRNLCKKESIPREASEFPRIKCQQPMYQRSESMGPAEGRRSQKSPFPYSAHTSSFKGSIHSATARVNMTILSKMPWSPQLAKPQHSAPSLTLKNPTPLSKASAPHTRNDSSRVPTALERGIEPREHCCTGVTKTESYQGQETPGNPNGAPQNPAVTRRFGFMRHFRYFLRQWGLKK